MEQFSLPVMTVSQLNTVVKDLISEIPAFHCVYVSGEISNFTAHYRSGHYYMSIKDDKSVIKAVMFRNQNMRLKFMPENGMKVLVKARLGVYERDGVYQLYIDDIQPQGAGALSVAYEQLKNKLQAKGLFDEERKKPIPKYPRKIGVITSPTGAAVRDIRDILSRRYPVAEIVFCGVTVQGENAAPEIISAIKKLNDENEVDVIIVGRGGGSIEDLWAFNNESLALAIADSHIPIISAVGHETDFTISDFVADLRAPTPSAAAELAVPDIRDLKNYLNKERAYLNSLMSSRLKAERMRLDSFRNRRSLKDMRYILDSEKERLDALFLQMQQSVKRSLFAQRDRLGKNAALLDSLSPLKILSRGYSVTRRHGELVKDVGQVKDGDKVSVTLSRGTLICTVDERTLEYNE